MPRNTKYLCIHGHFYQPPRENPWTGEIEEQKGAAPYHDWNEKIYNECYLPNTEAVIETGKGTKKKINNFEYLNFNFGATLFNWIKEKHPETYDKILEADKISVKKHSGHGNAIAMAYNHAILPLANRRDKQTQIRWGLRDFEYHFNRKPEGMWLPETACDYDTIEMLINEGVKYIILDPFQADSIRKKGDKKWNDVSSGGIDTSKAYICRSKKDGDKFINVFFYTHALSKEMSFGDLLANAEKFMDCIKAVNSKGGDIINLATDGETFGHHKPFGERGIAYLLSVLAPDEKYKVVNYGEYLELCPPQYEVRIKQNPTSWTCYHGVERWRADCGCTSSSEEGWNQKWRRPLRESLDFLRDKAVEILEDKGIELFENVWDARNDYVDLILEDSDVRQWYFFEKHAKRLLKSEEVKTALKLFEMQKYAQLMYTSCGWFFAEISGIETVKILEYAARLIELYEDVAGKDLEVEFLDILAEAESNLPEYTDGRDVYNKLVKPAMSEV